MSASTAQTLTWLGIGGGVILMMVLVMTTMGDPGPAPEAPARDVVVATTT